MTRRDAPHQFVHPVQREVGSGNVFEDLGHPRPAEALAKAELARKIAEVIAKRRLTQAAAAALLNLDQPKVSALVRGRLAGFSLDRLVRLLILLGSEAARSDCGAGAGAGRLKLLDTCQSLKGECPLSARHFTRAFQFRITVIGAGMSSTASFTRMRPSADRANSAPLIGMLVFTILVWNSADAAPYLKVSDVA